MSLSKDRISFFDFVEIKDCELNKLPICYFTIIVFTRVSRL